MSSPRSCETYELLTDVQVQSRAFMYYMTLEHEGFEQAVLILRMACLLCLCVFCNGVGVQNLPSIILYTKIYTICTSKVRPI